MTWRIRQGHYALPIVVRRDGRNFRGTQIMVVYCATATLWCMTRATMDEREVWRQEVPTAARVIT